MEASKLKLVSLSLSYVLVTIVLHLMATTAMRDGHLGNNTDHMALLAVKSKLTGDSDGVLSSWNHSLHHCSWEGVTCGRKHNRVVALNLSSHALAGAISPFIGNLSFLKVISLYNNSLSGPIPPEIGRLFRLQVLELLNNTLVGEIPANLSACTNLQLLNVANNKLKGNLPLQFRALSKIIQINLSSNNLTGPLFAVISNLTSLKQIHAAYNAFTGIIPTSIGQMRNLTMLAIGANKLSGTFPTSIFNCSLLEILSVGLNNLYGEFPSDIGFRLPRLAFLDLAVNQFSGGFPTSVLNLTNLEFLQLDKNNFKGRVPRDFGHLQNLWHLTMPGNHLEGDINFISTLVNCTKLEVLELSANDFTGMLPKSIANLSTSIWLFELHRNRIRGEIPVGITNLINLSNLKLGSNEITGSIPHDLGKLQNLEVIYLASSKLTGSIPDSLGNLSRLSYLYLQDNQFQGNIPQSLENCESLLVLYMSDNRLNGTLPEQLFKGSNFYAIDVGSNLLTGSIPAAISNQINLVEFYVYQNKLSGLIRAGLGECSMLQWLDMHGNLFHGHIPSSFGTLGSLQTVDLSQNNLSGPIPKYLSRFPLLWLNLSYNNLEGEVPTKGVFTNVSAIALDGNKMLCGGIPELHLLRCVQQKGGKKRRKMSRALKLIIPIACTSIAVLLIAIWIYLFCHRKTRKSTSSDSMKEFLRKVSYNRLLKATDGFSPENLLGTGSFGSVFRGNLDGKMIAVKVLNLQTRGACKSFMAECKALRNVRHRNLIGIITACSSIDFQRNDFRALVYEFMPNGSLDGWLHGAENLSLLQRVDIAIDVAHALNYLHHGCETPIAHCDLKPSNILLDSDMVAHVGDFGLAKFLAQPQHPNQSSSIGIRGTVGYAAPEYGLGSEPSPEGDIYSYGIVVLELMTGKRPTDSIFQEDYNLHMYAKATLSDQVLQIVDPTLDEESEMTEDIENTREIQATNEGRVECMVNVIKVGVACSNHMPQDRMKISDSIRNLQVARDKVRNARRRRNFPRGP